MINVVFYFLLGCIAGSLFYIALVLYRISATLDRQHYDLLKFLPTLLLAIRKSYFFKEVPGDE